MTAPQPQASADPDDEALDDADTIAFDDEAVMFVEISYDYQPIVSAKFVGSPVIK